MVAFSIQLLLLALPRGSARCPWHIGHLQLVFTGSTPQTSSHTCWRVPKHTCGLTRTWGPLHAPQQPRVRPAAALTHKSHSCMATLRTLARHPLALPYMAACVHTQEVTQMCTHTQVCMHRRPGFTLATCEARIALPALGALLAGACLAQLCSNPGAAPGCRWGLSSPPSPRMGT